MAELYEEARVHRVLAEDGRTAELGIGVKCRGALIVLSGQVESPQRSADVERRLRQRLPGYRVVNNLVVAGVEAPTESEEVP